MMPTHATKLINASKMKTLARMTSKVMMVTSRALEGQPPCGEQGPPRSRFSRVPPKETSLFFPSANLQFLVTLGWGYNVHHVGFKPP
jgi:hypothetical protein